MESTICCVSVALARTSSRCSRRHGLERRQSETFIQRGEHESGRALVKNTQRIKRHEAKKARAVLDAAVNHGPPDGRIAGNLIADNDQAQIGIERVAGELV